jgi:hypothetical protein
MSSRSVAVPFERFLRCCTPTLPLLLSCHSERSEEFPRRSNLQCRPRGSSASPSALETAQAPRTDYLCYGTALDPLPDCRRALKSVHGYVSIYGLSGCPRFLADCPSSVLFSELSFRATRGIPAPLQSPVTACQSIRPVTLTLAGFRASLPATGARVKRLTKW